MTYVSIISNAAFTLGPSVALYKAAAIGEEDGLGSLLWLSFLYICTQLVKMFLLNVFVPSIKWEQSETLSEDVIKAIVNVVDLVTMHYIASSRSIALRPHKKFILIGLAWAGTALLADLPAIWYGSSSTEFDWVWLHKAIDASLLLAVEVAAGAAMILFAKNDLSKVSASASQIVLAILAFRCARDVLFRIASDALSLPTIPLYAFKIATTLFVAFLADKTFKAYVSVKTK